MVGWGTRGGSGGVRRGGEEWRGEIKKLLRWGRETLGGRRGVDRVSGSGEW